MAIHPGALIRCNERLLHPLGEHNGTVSNAGSGRGRSTMGQEEEQGEHELRQDGPRHPLLLRQDDSNEGPRQTFHIPVQFERHAAPVQSKAKRIATKCRFPPSASVLTQFFPLILPATNLTGTCHNFRCVTSFGTLS